MKRSGQILIINPGSTSTKLSIYSFDRDQEKLSPKAEAVLEHTDLDDDFSKQLDIRYQDVLNFLAGTQTDLEIIMARGAPLYPLSGGTYEVNGLMLDDLKKNKYSRHASNFAALIGARIGEEKNIPVYITDPITTDEFEPLARISGVPGIQRKSRSHALNIKASLRRCCFKNQIEYAKSSWVVCHMGGGISIAAVNNSKIIDVNDALLGMGPFGPERAGALPTAGLLDLVYATKQDRSSIENLLSKESGLIGYLGSSDLREVENMIDSGDEQAALIFQAMVYQICKEIASMASVLKFDLDGILLTGGMAHSERLCHDISIGVQALGKVFVEAGQNEMKAMAEAALRIINETEAIKTYKISS